MNKGAFVIARNNGHIDYVKQAVFLAKRIKKYLDIPVTIATDSADYLKNTFDVNIFDNVIELPYTDEKNLRYFFDGTLSKKTASFKNANRANVYNLTPYDETLLMDTDYIISNDLFKIGTSSFLSILFSKSVLDLSL